MSSRTPSVLIEEIAAAIVMAEVKDKSSFANLASLFEEFKACHSGDMDPGIEEYYQACLSLLADLQKDDLANPEETLKDLSAFISEMQRMIADAVLPARQEIKDFPAEENVSSIDETAPAESVAPTESITSAESVAQESGKLILPPWVDETTFRDFLASHKGSLEEIESNILALERGEANHLPDLMRRIHTMKGEAGVMGLDDLQQLYHSLEDFLNSPTAMTKRVDILLFAKDWISNAIEAYALKQTPTAPISEVLNKIKSAMSGESHRSIYAPQASAADSPTTNFPVLSEVNSSSPFTQFFSRPTPSSEAHVKIKRSDETISELGEFLQESNEGINRADQILMNIERDGITAEAINDLFRVFHTIKGVAGFHNLSEVTSLAHATEALLNLARQSSIELQGSVLDLVFDATALMRRLLDGIRNALNLEEEFYTTPELPPLMEKLRGVVEGRRVPESNIPPVAPGAMLGEILQQTASIPGDIIEKALTQQKSSGRRLGEELVAEGLVEPKQVVQALRAQTQADAGGSKIKETIKVDLDRVDRLVELIGELVIVESMVVNMPEIAGISTHRARNYLGQLTKITRDLQSMGMRMRMVPVRTAFQKMARLVRDLSRKGGKEVRMVLSGEGTEMDRSMVEQVSDPLVHMIRNAVDHGIEPVQERLKSGKPGMALIRLSAYHESGNIVIEISDDGRGLNQEAILTKALAQGLIQEGQKLSDAEIYDLIFKPGFSTAKQVTEISGRGVGMDVVKRNVEAMRGRIVISTVPGQGTTFKIILPLTLAIIEGMLVACGDERYIIPTLSIIESIKPDQSMLFSFAGKSEVINVRGDIFSLLRLDRLFNIPGAKTDPTQALVVVVESLGRKIGLMVDDVITQQQVVIKSLGTGMPGTQFVSNAAILSDGKVGLILNVEEISTVFDDRNIKSRLQEKLATAPTNTTS